MTTSDLHSALLRPAVLQILRAVGFNNAKPAVIDSLTDLTARYILLLASSTVQNALVNHGDVVPTVQDVRLALGDAGALRPQMSSTEEVAREPEEVNGELVPFEDLRGVQAFSDWVHGPVNKEIRRIGGFGDEIDVAEVVVGGEEKEDYLSGMFSSTSPCPHS